MLSLSLSLPLPLPLSLPLLMSLLFSLLSSMNDPPSILLAQSKTEDSVAADRSSSSSASSLAEKVKSVPIVESVSTVSSPSWHLHSREGKRGVGRCKRMWGKVVMVINGD